MQHKQLNTQTMIQIQDVSRSETLIRGKLNLHKRRIHARLLFICAYTDQNFSNHPGLPLLFSEGAQGLAQ